MFSKKQTSKRILISGIVAITAIVLALVGSWLMSDKIEETAEDTLEARESAFTFQNRLSTLTILERKLAVVGDNVNLIKGAIPPAEDITPFINRLEQAGRPYSLSTRVDFGELGDFEDRNGLSIATLGYTVNVGGVDMDTLIDYLSDLEHLPFIAQVDLVNMQSSAGGGLEESMNVQIEGTLYVQQES